MRLLLLVVFACVINSQKNACPQLKFSFRPQTLKSLCLVKSFKLVSCDNRYETSFDYVVLAFGGLKSYETETFSIQTVQPGVAKLGGNGKCLTLRDNLITEELCTENSNEQLFLVVPVYGNVLKPRTPFREEHIANSRPYFSKKTPFTDPPSTCKPVHLEHLGRHASRHINLKKQFTGPIRVLEFAKSQNSITPLAEELLLSVQKLENETFFIPERQLTPQGFQTSYEIGSRLVKNFPEIFLSPSVFNMTTNRIITVDSTPTKRTEQTRDFYVRGMVDTGIDSNSLNIETPDHCSRSFINLRSFDTCNWYKSFTRNSSVFMALAELRERLAGPEGLAERFHQMMFKTGFQPAGADRAKIDFVENWWKYVCTFQLNVNRSNTGEACSVFTEADGELLAYLDDTQVFLTHGRVPGNPIETALSCGLMEEIVNGLNQAILDSQLRKSPLTDNSPDMTVAHLRFAHKETLIPLLGSLWVDVEDPFVYKDSNYADREFKGSEIYMMGSNVQFIMYECGDSGQHTYKVKMMLNEVERIIPGCPEIYCDWGIVADLMSRTACDPTLHDQICGGHDQSICQSIGDPSFRYDKR